MKSNDVPIGAGLLVVALLTLWHVSTFPPAPGQPYNAALFPGIAAAGLAMAAIALIISGLRMMLY
jgi:putative tricarboxylic transport membrane protein